MVAQIRFGHNVTRISPCVVYQRTIEAVAGSGVGHYESFLNQVRKYRAALRQFFLDYYPLDINRSHAGARSMGEAQNDRELVDGLSSRPFAAADIPKFHDDPIPMADSMSSLLWNIAILSAFSAVFFMAAYICFLYQDIK